jgi:hypothetical protein
MVLLWEGLCGEVSRTKRNRFGRGEREEQERSELRRKEQVAREVSARGEIIGKEGWRAMLCFGHLERKMPRA